MAEEMDHDMEAIVQNEVDLREATAFVKGNLLSFSKTAQETLACVDEGI